ncbi:MAG: 4Fe-4S dicluster domain-containing protein [Ignavibacteriae bacterium]|nr:4Fe-4S dicluster domain-containing protein [Ignavibacteriota bacterium]
MEPTLHSVAGLSGTIWLVLLVAVSLLLFALRAAFWVRILRLSKSDNRFSHVGRRLALVVRDVFLQPRFRDHSSPVHTIVWPVHLVIFWGFVVYAVSFAWSLLRGLLPDSGLPWPEQIGPIALLIDVFGALVLAALVISAVRRYVLRPEGVKRTVDAAIILTLIALVMITALAGGSAAVAYEGHASAWRPVSSALAAVVFADGRSAEIVATVFWWLHTAIVLGFFSYLPYSKHFHLLVSPFNVYFSDLSPKGSLPGDGDLSANERLDLRDFTWRELLSSLSCAECGRCDRACPSHNSGEGLSPQDVVHAFKEHMLTTGSVLARSRNGGSPAVLSDEILAPEQVWACATCYSCMEHCPVRNEHIPLLIRARRHEVSRGRVDTHLQDTLVAMTRYGNSFGQSERARAKWSVGLPFKIPDARKQAVQTLWFVGDTASYDVRAHGSTRAMAQILHAAGVEFGILYEAERCAGNDARRVGEEGLFQMLAEKNLAVLAKCTFDEIITTDPHTYNTLRNEYPALGGSFRVRHHSEVLAEILATGVLNTTPLGLRATYHDACYLGRYNGIYDAPRRTLEALGVRLTEMPRAGRDGYCCGAGGGRLWMEDRPGALERPAESRVREAAALPQVDTLVAACPKDLVMFLDAVKTANIEGRLTIRELAELVWQSVSTSIHEAEGT